MAREFLHLHLHLTTTTISHSQGGFYGKEKKSYGKVKQWSLGVNFFKDILFYAWRFGGVLLGSKKHEIPLFTFRDGTMEDEETRIIKMGSWSFPLPIPFFCYLCF